MTSLNADTRIRFYHTPKAGGTAVFNMTTGWKNFKRAHPHHNHVPIKDYPPSKDETALTIIRHPYSRFESAFYHMVDACKDNFYYRHARVSDCETLKRKNIHFEIFRNDPNEFLLALENTGHPFHREAKVVFETFSIFRPQFYWLSDPLGLHLHHSLKIILHQENLQREFDIVAEKLGHIPQWPSDAMSNRRLTASQDTLNDHSKGILQVLYKSDFKHFQFPTTA